MISAFSQLLEGFRGLFGRDFLMSGFLPMTVMSVLSGGLAYWSLPSSRPVLTSFLDTDLSEQIVTGLAVLFLIFLAAFILWGLSSWFRRILEGQGGFWLASGPLRILLERLQQNELLELERLLRLRRRQLFGLRKALRGRPSWVSQLKAARLSGEGEPDMAEPADRPSRELLRLFRRLEERRRRRQVIFAETLSEAFEMLRGQLEAGPVNDRLDSLQGSFLELLRYSIDRLENEVGRLQGELETRFPKDVGGLGPTRLANLAEVHREYALERYGIQLEWIWPRILKLVQADEKFLPMLQAAKTRLDFSVSMIVVFGGLTIVWSAVTLIWSKNPAPFLVTALAGPLVTRIFYAVVVESYEAFSEASLSAVDLFRFDLLRQLNLKLPTDAESERKVWTALCEGDVPDKAIRYVLPKET